MADPTVTVGIPFFNARTTLLDAVRSVFAQTFSDWRLILLDDGSRDGSADIARRVRDSRVEVLSDGKNLGLVARLNQIATIATGPFVARMDSDDLMHPERLERQVRYLEKHPDIQVLGTATFTMDADSAPTGFRGGGPIRHDLRSILYRGLFVHPSVMYRTDFARAHPYDERYPRCEDLQLWCRLAGSDSLAKLDTPLLFYREPAPINMRNYAASARTRRAIVRHFGPAALTRSEVAALTVKSHASVLAYRAAGVFSAHRFLLRTRNRRLSTELEQQALAALRTIRETPVPGAGDA